MTSLSDIIKSDSRVERGMKVLRVTELDLDSIIQELLSLHSSRKMRALSRKKLLESSSVVLIDTTIQEAAFRSRAVDIKIKVLIEMMKKEEVYSTLRKYILSKYKNRLSKRGFKSLTSQRDYVSVLLFDKYLSEARHMQNVVQITDLVISDIDSSGWGLKRIEEVLTNLSKEKFQ